MSNINRSSLDALSSSNFPDNTTQLISAADLRDWIESAVDSFVTQKDKSTFENAFYEAKSATIMAAPTVLLSNASGNFVHIQGTTTITSFGTCPAGSRFILCFEDAVIVTYNATTLIIPGAANITTTAGDCMMIISEGAGIWRVVGYFPGTGLPVGTVTSVSGTGSVNGITLSGTVTTTGSLTLGGSLSGVDLASQVTGVLPVANGGSGTATPSLVAGTNVTISGSWPNQTINASGGGTPGGDPTEVQYNNSGSFDGIPELTYSGGFVQIETPKIGTSVGNGHMHIHTINTNAPNGLTDYITIYADKSPKQLGARFETDAFTSALQFGATTDRTYTFPDATGNVVLDTTSQTLTNKTLDTPLISGIANFTDPVNPGEIRLFEASPGADYIAIKAPSSASGYSLTLPGTSPGTNQVLVSDISGTLTWNSGPLKFVNQFLRNYNGSFVAPNNTEQFLQSIYIPAGTYTDTTGYMIKAGISRTTPTSNTVTIRLYINTTNAVGGFNLTTNAIAVAGSGNGFIQVERMGFIQIATGGSKNTVYATTAANIASNNVAQSGSVTQSAIDWGVDQYVVLSCASGLTGSTITRNYLTIMPQ